MTPLSVNTPSSLFPNTRLNPFPGQYSGLQLWKKALASQEARSELGTQDPPNPLLLYIFIGFDLAYLLLGVGVRGWGHGGGMVINRFIYNKIHSIN